MTHTEMTAHIRNRIKVAGIKANVHKERGMNSKCGITIVSASPSVGFTRDEIRTICTIADVNLLTMVMGDIIDVEHEARADASPLAQWNFYMPGTWKRRVAAPVRHRAVV